MSINEKYYTVAELADILTLTDEYIRVLIRRGKLQATKFNGAYLIDKADAERLIKERNAS